MSKTVRKEIGCSHARYAGRILSLMTIALMAGAIVLTQEVTGGEREGPTIIDPRLSAYGALPLHPYDRSKGIVVEEMDPKDPNRLVRGVRYGHNALWPPGRPPARPSGLLIKGRVSDPLKRWAAVLARDERDLREQLATYRSLIASGDWIRALQLLRPIDMQVATSVAAYRGMEKIKDMPENVGTFFLAIPMYALDKRGWFITFLPHTLLHGGDIVDYGPDLGEQVGGMLKVEEIQAGKDYIYRMKILKAQLSDETLRDRSYSVRSH